MKIALITGSRSDRNALEMVTGALSEAGHDASLVDYVSKNLNTKKVLPVSVASDAIALTSYLGIGEDGYRFADMVFIHGDRYEALAIAFACNVMGIPIAHLGGGDITEGSQDDCFRHAITKLSHLHFPTNQDAADRIIQMGEEPDRVHMVGDAGIDRIMATPLLEREETFQAVRICSLYKAILVLFHPNTLGNTEAELNALSIALRSRHAGGGKGTESIVLIGPNADAGSEAIRKEWQRLAAERPDTVYHDNVEPQVFYSLLKWCDVMIGNSSAGFYEAPCFGIPVINLGDRQKGRPRADNIEQAYAVLEDTHYHADRERWTAWAIDQLDSRIGVHLQDYVQTNARGMPIGRGAERKPVANPYGDGHAAERIAKVIGEIKEPKALLRKRFRGIEERFGE